MPVCITGMHRSGTSMVAKMLNSCGLCLGAESALVAPSRDNPGGYWENKNFVSINNGILSEFGSSWDYPRRLPDGWESEQKMVPYRARVEALLQGLKDHEPWGWKDPRTCLTLPFWMSILPQTKVVVCLRNPLEVVLSLHRRNPPKYTIGLTPWRVYDLLHAPLSSLRQKLTPHPLGFTAWKASNKVEAAFASRTRQNSSLRQLGLALTKRYDQFDYLLKLRRRKPLSYRIGLQLWEIYNRRILEFTCPQSRLITHYDAYFSYPQGELRRVLNFLEMPASDEEIERGCATAVAGLRHHRTTTRQLMKAGVPAEVSELYRRMCEESEFVEDQTYENKH
ncbi:MAG: sulfotransferase [Acidobacteriota bacterium]|nr:sulfotransferase [Acidobacteriota bacterium]